MPLWPCCVGVKSSQLLISALREAGVGLHRAKTFKHHQTNARLLTTDDVENDDIWKIVFRHDVI